MTEENTAPNGNEGTAPAGAEPQFALTRIYIKDASFEAPNGMFTAQQGKPKISQDLNTHVNRLQETLFEVVLKLTVTVSIESKTAFLIEVHQAGLFMISGVDGPQLQQLVSTQCPHILFPYAREAVDSLAVRGGFAPLALPPINFDALFVQAIAEARRRAEAEGQTAPAAQ